MNLPPNAESDGGNGVIHMGRLNRACRKFSSLTESGPSEEKFALQKLRSKPMILNAIAEKLKRQSKDDFKGRHLEAWVIVQAVTWYLRYPLSYRDLEEMFRERGFEVDHSTINRWVLVYAPIIERRLRRFRRPHCGSVRIDETYVKVRGKWRYLYHAIDKEEIPLISC